MGFAIAERLATLGAKVFLISGPVSLQCNHENIVRINVVSAEEMYAQCLNYFGQCNGAVMVAAVADFAPVSVGNKKIKRTSQNLTLELRPNPDIAAGLGKIKREDQVLVGFALETHDEVQNALLKLRKKNLDFIVLNSLSEPGSGFQVDTNRIRILDNRGGIYEYEQKQKSAVAVDIVDKLIAYENSGSDIC